MKLYQKLASTIAAIANCKRSDNSEWLEKHEATLSELMDKMPSGSGFDNGTELDESSTFDKLIFNTAFHHMDDSGSYDGWTEHNVTITGSLLYGFTSKISGSNRSEIKDYISECFDSVLNEEIE